MELAVLQVNQVLKEIGADQIPQLLVWNKIDLAELEPSLEMDEYDKIQRVFVSGRTGVGMDLLRDAIATYAKFDALKFNQVPQTIELNDERFI